MGHASGYALINGESNKQELSQVVKKSIRTIW